MQAAAAAALSIDPIPTLSPSKALTLRLGCSTASRGRRLSIKVTATTYDTSIVDYSFMLSALIDALSVFPAEACETIGGDACAADIYPEVRLQQEARTNSPRTTTEVFCAEACDDLGGEFCSREYQRGVY
ncbi:Detected protein of unknown function [Hibiscus syriacus]|uniref:Uncharacterized protein n=1 Tax=Hibiscus syriacus TaxID=106335 RepID=A0A6A3A2K1_HIBSY|nr:Detected protein of unknown function [Hibiscus syriacus]